MKNIIVWILFGGVWLFGFPSVLNALGDAKKTNSKKSWIFFICAVVSFVLIPIERFKSEADSQGERDRLELNIKETKQFNKELGEQNKELKKQIELLNTLRRHIAKFGIKFTANFVISGIYQQPTYKGIPGLSPSYVAVKDSKGSVPEILFKNQGADYQLDSLGTSSNAHSFKFSVSSEILDAQHPVGEALEVLKKYDTVEFYVPFVLTSVVTNNVEVGQFVMVDSVEAEVIINGIKTKGKIAGGNIASRVAARPYSQGYWISIPIRFKKNLYDLLSLSGL